MIAKMKVNGEFWESVFDTSEILEHNKYFIISNKYENRIGIMRTTSKLYLKLIPLASNIALLETEQDKENNRNKEFFSCLLLVG